MGFVAEDFKHPQVCYEKWEFLKGLKCHSGAVGLSTCTEATLPIAADYPGGLIYVSDGPAANKVRYSDGSSWVTLG